MEPSLTVDKWSRTNLTMQNLSMEHLSRQHLSMQHLSMQHLSMQHLSLQHLSEQHLSRDKIWLFTIATTPVWTKQSNFKLATSQTKTWPTPAYTELGTAQPQLVYLFSYVPDFGWIEALEVYDPFFATPSFYFLSSFSSAYLYLRLN